MIALVPETFALMNCRLCLKTEVHLYLSFSSTAMLQIAVWQLTTLQRLVGYNFPPMGTIQRIQSVKICSFMLGLSHPWDTL